MINRSIRFQEPSDPQFINIPDCLIVRTITLGRDKCILDSGAYISSCSTIWQIIDSPALRISAKYRTLSLRVWLRHGATVVSGLEVQILGAKACHCPRMTCITGTRANIRTPFRANDPPSSLVNCFDNPCPPSHHHENFFIQPWSWMASELYRLFEC